MKTLLKQIQESLHELFQGSDALNKLPLMSEKLDQVLLNQEALSAYLGMTPGAGATPEELDVLGARIREEKERIEKLNQTTTGQIS